VIAGAAHRFQFYAFYLGERQKDEYLEARILFGWPDKKVPTVVILML